MMGASARLAYPGKIAIRHVVDAAKACGIDVGGLEVSPDGKIKILDMRAMPKVPMNDFDRLEAQGLL